MSMIQVGGEDTAGAAAAGGGGEAETAREVGPAVVLPSGWEERQDANGRTYYVNHVGEHIDGRIFQTNYIIFQLVRLNGSTLDLGSWVEEGKRAGAGEGV